MANTSRNSARKVRMPLWAWLCYLLAATLLFTGGASFSKYRSTASGTATARVAKFDVQTTALGTNNPIILKGGDSSSGGSYAFTVRNDSEVTVTSKVIVGGLPENVNGLPANVKGLPANVKVTLTVDGASFSKTSNGNDPLTFDIGQVGIGKFKSCALTFNAEKVTEKFTGEIRIDVASEQVD